LLPVIFVGFLSYARFLFLPASTYGISTAHPIRSLAEGAAAAGGGRDKLVFVNNGFVGGDIEGVITAVTNPLTSGTEIVRLTHEEELLTECRNTILGTSSCSVSVFEVCCAVCGEACLMDDTILGCAKSSLSFA